MVRRSNDACQIPVVPAVSHTSDGVVCCWDAVPVFQNCFFPQGVSSCLSLLNGILLAATAHGATQTFCLTCMSFGISHTSFGASHVLRRFPTMSWQPRTVPQNPSVFRRFPMCLGNHPWRHKKTLPHRCFPTFFQRFSLQSSGTRHIPSVPPPSQICGIRLAIMLLMPPGNRRNGSRTNWNHAQPDESHLVQGYLAAMTLCASRRRRRHSPCYGPGVARSRPLDRRLQRNEYAACVDHQITSIAST